MDSELLDKVDDLCAALTPECVTAIKESEILLGLWRDCGTVFFMACQKAIKEGEDHIEQEKLIQLQMMLQRL